MITGGGPFAHGAELWRVRVRRGGDDVVLGAGVLVAERYVLTCAHVVAGVDPIVVDMVALEGARAVSAEVVVAKEPEGDRGDVALLRLAEAQPPGVQARLRRGDNTWDRHVHALGYPQGPGLDIGVWARMRLAAGAGAEWWQMNRRSDGEPRVSAGFSGSGVADDATGDVLGIVVSEYTDETAGLSWMLPVKAIEAHLPVVSEWVLDEVPPARPSGAVGALVDWLARSADGAAVLVVVGDGLADLREAVALSAARRTAGPDLALNVEGLSAEQVAERVVKQAGLDPHGSSTERVREGTPPMTVVADGVDQADEPEAVIDRVFRPMVDGGARVVVGFHSADSAGVEAAHALARAVVAGRLDACAERIAALGAGADHGDGSVAAKLRFGLTALRKAAAEDHERVAARLAKFERAVARAEHAHAVRRGVAVAVADELGLLDALRARAADLGLAEHPEVAAAFRAAYAVADTHPVDLAALRAAVRRCQDVIRRAAGEGGGR